MLRSWFVPLILQHNLLTSCGTVLTCFDHFLSSSEHIWAPKHRFCSSSCWHNATGHRVGIQTPGIHAQTCPAGSRSRCKMGGAVLSVLQTFFFVSSCGLMIDFMSMYTEFMQLSWKSWVVFQILSHRSLSSSVAISQETAFLVANIVTHIEVLVFHACVFWAEHWIAAEERMNSWHLRHFAITNNHAKTRNAKVCEV